MPYIPLARDINSLDSVCKVHVRIYLYMVTSCLYWKTSTCRQYFDRIGYMCDDVGVLNTEGLMY